MKKIYWPLVAFFLIAPTFVSAAISLDNYTRDTSCSGITTCNVSFTIVTSDLLVVGVYDDTGVQPTSCEYDSVPMTNEGAATGDGSIDGWYLLNPTVGTHNITCVFPTTSGDIILNAAGYATGGYTFVSSDAGNPQSTDPWSYAFTGTATSFGVLISRNNENTYSSVSGATVRSSLPVNGILMDSNGVTTAGTNTWTSTVSAGDTAYHLYDFMLFDQGSSPPTPSSASAATSTLDQSERNLSTAFFIFFIGMFGTIWLLRRK